MGFYMVFFQSLPALGLVIAGFVISGAGWRWWLWVTIPRISQFTANARKR